jgi:DIS3-like exonuclease 1
LQDRRLAKGALELESVELRFELDKDKRPVNIKTKADIEMMAMVAEYMITANVAVAEFLYKQFPSCALLRRHTLPRLEAFEELIRLAHEKGFNIDTSSNKSLATSLSAAVTGDKTFNHLLKSLATLAMAEAEYFSTGQHESHEFYHYGLAADYYTHFTSPIRRYADVLVHRQLIRALAGQPPPLGNNQLQEVAEHINEKHRQAKQVQRDSSELFQVLYFKDRNIAEDAVIYNFKNNGFLVYIQKYEGNFTHH